METANGRKPGDVKHTILLVDDEEFILDIGKGLLELLEYEVITAQSGHTAIEIYKRMPEKISLIILDMSMPEIDGGVAFEEFKKIDPQVKVIISTGYNIEDRVYEIVEKGAVGFIQKPYSIEKLSEVIRRGLNK